MIILGLNAFHGDSAAALIRDGKLVEGMWLIPQQDTPDDYVLATGESYSVREFVKAFAHVGRIITWRGRGVEEKGVDKATDQVLVEVEQGARQARMAPQEELRHAGRRHGRSG